jgi:hypothetical protein
MSALRRTYLGDGERDTIAGALTSEDNLDGVAVDKGLRVRDHAQRRRS